MKIGSGRTKAYRIASILILIVLALLFLFPLYWIVTGSFKSAQDIYAAEPKLFPTEWVTTNFEKLFAKRSAPLWELHVPFAQDANGDPLVFSTGPIVPGAIRWLVNTVFMSVMAMILTCITAAMAGYALAKKRFVGRQLLFTLIVCAMALPKQVIVIPLSQMLADMHLRNTLWAVILPTVGWPFGVFLMKQFSETVPTEILEAARVDGSGELRTFFSVVFPMIKPGIGALAIFTFVNTWNDYFLQLVMLVDRETWTLPLAIANLQGEMSSNFGLIMAGAALASVPIIIVFIAFQKYFTQGIAMGAVKG